ncbi:MAG: hypothetical protein ACREHD_09010 [Pirellulales bacterium]
MTYQGTVQNGVVVLAAGATLPEGTQVKVVPQVSAPTPPKYDPSMSIGEKLAELARWSETFPTNLPSDLAKNHDHYLHGRPKKP